MIVILPTEERVPVPEYVNSIEGLHGFLTERTGYPRSVQHLYFQASELSGEDPIPLDADDVTIDLVLQVGPSFVVCRAGMKEHLDRGQTEVFVPHNSMRKARRLDHFVGPPVIKVGTDPGAGKEQAAVFFAAFEERKTARLRRLRQLRGSLEPGPIVISSYNWGYRQMVENWAASCDRYKIDCRNFTILFPTDERADAHARELGFVTFFDGKSYGDLPTEAAGVFGDRIFAQMLFAKTAMTVDMLNLGGDFLRQDVDMVWLRDPRRDLVTRMDRQSLDMQFMFDGPSHRHQPLYYNSGFVFIRCNSFTRHMWKLVFDNYGQILKTGSEQQIINMIAHCLRERGLRMERLPEDVYVNGHIISRALHDHTDLPANAAVIHASWTSDIGRKMAHMKKYRLWFLE